MYFFFNLLSIFKKIDKVYYIPSDFPLWEIVYIMQRRCLIYIRNTNSLCDPTADRPHNVLVSTAPAWDEHSEPILILRHRFGS